MRPRGLSCLVIAMVLTSPVSASGAAVLIGEYGAWRTYRAEGEKLEICFAASMPISREPKELRRGEGYVFVSHRKSEGIRDDLSFVLGYPLQASADATLTIGANTFTLMEKGEAAWLEDAEQQRQVIEAFRREHAASVVTTSARGNRSQDEYSLQGFTRAYAAMINACK